MSYFDDANQLVQYAREHFLHIEEAYNASLSEKEIKPKLLIEIKNFMENFSTNDEPVLSLLKQTLEGVIRIVRELASI